MASDGIVTIRHISMTWGSILVKTVVNPGIIGHTDIPVAYPCILFAFDVTAMLWCFITNYEEKLLCNFYPFTGPWMLQCASMRPILQQCLQMR